MSSYQNVFDACDGIFTNYNWTEQSLEWMKSYSAAQGRFADIYVGVDVFARGKVVGGKFETNKVSEVLENNFNIWTLPFRILAFVRCLIVLK